MNLSELINEILSEWAYRVENGMPNPKNPIHLKQLGIVLSEMGLSHIKNDLVENLLTEKGKTPQKNVAEAEGNFTNPALNKSIKYKNDKGEDAEGIVGNLLRLAKEHPGRVAAEKTLPPEGSPERDSLNKDLGAQNKPKGDEQPKDAKGGEEAPKEDPAKAAAAMFDPKADPAMAARMDKEKEVQVQLAKDAEAQNAPPPTPKNQTTNKKLAKAAGFDNVGTWYNDLNKKAMSDDPEVSSQAQADLDTYEKNKVKDAQAADDNFNPIDSKDVAKEMPQADPDTFSGGSDIPDGVTPEELDKFNTDISKVAQQVADAKAKGEPAPNINLCDVTVPGTNLYCDDNLGIPRDEMPQFKGTAQPGSKAAGMGVDASGEVDTEPVFKEMLKEKGIKTLQTQIPADKLKATQKDLVGAKVVGMMDVLKDPKHPAFEKITAPIYVSRDGHVIDGHHRWAAVVAHNAANPDNQIPMKTTVLDMDIKDAIPMANKFAEDIGIAPKKADANKEAPATEPTTDEPKDDKSNSWDGYEEPEMGKGKSSWDGMKTGWDGYEEPEMAKGKSSWDTNKKPDMIIPGKKPGTVIRKSDGKPDVVMPAPKKAGGVPPPPPPPPPPLPTKKAGAVPPPPPPPPPSTPTSAPKLTDKVKQKISNWTEKEKAFFDRNEGAPGSKERRSLGQALKDKAAGAWKAIKKGAKHEVEEFKAAGSGIKNFFSGKELSEHEVKAVKAVAFKVVTTAIFGAAFGGLSHGVAAFGKHVAMEFIPHIIGETVLKGVGKAAVFADMEGEAETDANMVKFAEMIADGLENMEITPEMMEQMVDSYNEKKENGEVDSETSTTGVKAEHLHLVDELMLEMIYGFIAEIKSEGKEGESKTHPGYFHIGGGYYSKKAGGKISHKTVDGSMIELSPEEKAEKNKTRKPAAAPTPVGKTIAPSGFRQTGEKELDPKKKSEPEVDYDKLTADQKKKMVDGIIEKNNAGFDKSKNKTKFAIQTISARNEDINKAHILPPGTPGSSFAENNGAKYVNNFFNGGVTKEKIDAATEEMMKTPLAQKIQPESARRGWAQVAVRTAVNEAQTLKNVPSYNAKNPQPDGLPQGAIMDAQNKAMVRKLLESKRDEAIANGDKKSEAHYKKQLGYLDKLKETDTGIIYQTNDGTIGFKHTSNKKTFKDPHSNSSPAKVMEAMRKTMGDKLNPELEKTFKESEQLLADSNQTVTNDTKAFVEAQSNKSPKQKTAENEAVGTVLSNFPISGGGRKDYINGPDGVTNKPWFKKYAAEKGLEKPYSNDTVLTAVYENAASDNPDQNAIDTVLKISEMVQNVNSKNIENTAKKYGITSEELSNITKSTEPLKETGRKRREVMAVVHTKIVKGIQDADASDPNVYPNNPNGENGPHQQAYVNDFLGRMHFTAYVTGERDGVSSHNINGVNVEPSFYRECLAKLTGFKGDTETEKGRAGLLTHMKKGLRVSPENDSIIFQDGKTKAKIGTETYRTKGKSKGVLGYLGPDLQKCLEGKADTKK